jgi:hypothetical protein
VSFKFIAPPFDSPQLHHVAKNVADRVEPEAEVAKTPVTVCVIDVLGNVVLQHRMKDRRPTSRNASRARFRSLNRLTLWWSRLAPRLRSCATMIAARRSGSLAGTRRIPAADRSPMSPHLPSGLSECGSVRPWRWMAEKLTLSRSSRVAVAVGPPKVGSGLPCRSGRS